MRILFLLGLFAGLAGFTGLAVFFTGLAGLLFARLTAVFLAAVFLAGAFFLGGCGLLGLGLGGNLDFLTGLDLVAVLDAVGTLEVLDRYAGFLGNLGQGFTLLNGYLAGLFGLGGLFLVLAAPGAAFGAFVPALGLVAVLLGILGVA